MRTMPLAGALTGIPTWFKVLVGFVALWVVGSLTGIINLNAAQGDPPDVLFAVDLEHELNATLTDYPSARFSDVHFAFAKDGRRYACGLINAKSLMGAYVGWRRFAAIQAPGEAPVIDLEATDCPTGAAWSAQNYATLLTR